MKIYYITLPRLKERYTYIRRHVQGLGMEAEAVVGVDGLALSEEELQRFCTFEYIRCVPRGMIGCTLSHREACMRFMGFLFVGGRLAASRT